MIREIVVTDRRLTADPQLSAPPTRHAAAVDNHPAGAGMAASCLHRATLSDASTTKAAR
jgi:hypothetical protein